MVCDPLGDAGHQVVEVGWSRRSSTSGYDVSPLWGVGKLFAPEMRHKLSIVWVLRCWQPSTHLLDIEEYNRIRPVKLIVCDFYIFHLNLLPKSPALQVHLTASLDYFFLDYIVYVIYPT